MTEEIRRIFLIHVDDILDTRLGTLKQHFPKVFSEYLKSHVVTGKYHQRLKDEFGPITYQEFREKYALRDIETLKHSILTNCEVFLASMLKDAYEESVAEPFRGEPEVVINTWPYDFDEELTKQFHAIMVARLKQYFNLDVKISFLHKNHEELTVEFCDQYFKAMFMYDLFDWMNVQADNFKKRLLFHTTAITPALFRDGDDASEEFKEAISKGQNPLKALEYLASMLIPTTMVDVKLFSIFGFLDAGLDENSIKASQVKKKDEHPVKFDKDGNVVFDQPEETTVADQIEEEKKKTESEGKPFVHPDLSKFIKLEEEKKT